MTTTLDEQTLLRMLGKTMKTRRKAKGWTLEQVAHEIGLKNPSPLSLFERGEGALLWSNLVRYADLVGLLEDMDLYLEVLTLLMRAPRSLTVLLRETLLAGECYEREQKTWRKIDSSLPEIPALQF